MYNDIIIVNATSTRLVHGGKQPKGGNASF